MSGYTLNIINEITKNLRDCYHSGFPVLKELIQNADDSKAKRFIFGQHSGFANAEHPLLKNTGLWFFNDGGFKASDKRAIRSFGENAKAGDSSSIGKFGLGMKSVFHLCEAFIYIAYDGHELHSAILNPWDKGEDGNIHADWFEPDEDTRLKLQEVATPHIDKSNTWFLLWIPLRKQCHLQTKDGRTLGSISERFCGDDDARQDLKFLTEPDVPNKLAVLLPLLPHLEEIRFISNNESTGFHLQLKTKGRLELDSDKKQEINSSGSVTISGQKTPLFKFSGKKHFDLNGLELGIFKEIKNHVSWSKTFCRDENGNEQQVPDKSKPEGAVLIGHEDDKAGELCLQWAVFLPLEEVSHIFTCPIPNSSRSYRIVLHGQYSIDSGRRGIHEFQQISKIDNANFQSLDQSALRRKWNQEVAQRVTLPLVLPTLADYVHNQKLKDEEITALTHALYFAKAKTGESTHFWNHYKDFLCVEYDWIRVLTETGAEWSLTKNDDNLRILPLPASVKNAPARPWQTFPGLKKLNNVIFRDHSAPSFQKQSHQWAEDDLITVFQAGIDEAFKSQAGLEYFADFLEMRNEAGRLKTHHVQNELLKSLGSGFASSFDVLTQNKPKVQRIATALSPERRLALGTIETNAKTTVPPHIWHTLWRCETQTLLLPKYFDDGNAAGKPSKEDVLQWLKALQKEILGKFSESALDVISDLLKTLDTPQRGILIRSNRELKIVSARNPRIGKNIAVSFGELETAKQRGNLFANQMNIELAELLTVVTPDEKILLLNADNIKIIFPNEYLPAANEAKAILASLVTGTVAKKLGSIHSRLELLNKASQYGSDSNSQLGLRYLLHGNSSHFKDSKTHLWIRGHEQSAAWEVLWQQINDSEGEENAWNVLDLKLAEALPRSVWIQLNLREISPDQVVQELHQKIHKVNAEKFTISEREEILLKVNDRELWRNLPLHSYDNGDVGSIKNTTYLSSIKLPKELQILVQIVTKSENANMLHQQENYISPMDEVASAKLALSTENPVNYWQLLLDAAPKMTEENIHEYSTKKWLPLENGQPIAPQDVIDCEKFADDIQRLAVKADYCYADVGNLSSDVLKHQYFDILKQNFFSKEKHDVLDKLGLLIDAADYAVGKLNLDESTFKKAASVLKSYSKLPAWGLIHKVIQEFSSEDCFEYLLPQLNRPIEIEQLIATLNWLAEQSEKNKSAFDVHLAYLGLLQNKDFLSKRSSLKLRSKSGRWTVRHQLCCGVSDIDDDFLLDYGQAVILERNGINITNANSTFFGSTELDGFEANFDSKLQATPKIIDDYFSDWTCLIRRELIGSLLVLFGESLHEKADSYLQSHSVDWLIDKLNWRDPIDINRTQFACNQRRFSDILKISSVAVKIVTEDNVKVRNILGEIISVPLTKELKTILAGAFDIKENRENQQKKIVVPLRKLDINKFTPEQLSDLLKNTAEQMLGEIYHQRNANLQTLWDELNESQQLEIAVVRNILLNHLVFYFKQLGVHNLPMFKIAIENNKRIETALAEARQGNDSQKIKQFQSNLEQSKNELATVLIENEDAQLDVLNKICAKLTDFQYELDSIPFELFQNADDAAIELGRCESYPEEKNIQIPEAAKRFVLLANESTIHALHWGRLLNYRGTKDTAERWSGYGDDLEKMLILSASDKTDDSKVTGRFGLGFKSVFLISDNPRILSGDLRVQIVGGILPEIWDDCNNTARLLESKKPIEPRYRGTAFEIPLRNDVDVTSIIQRFQKMAGLLSVFGRAIRQIEINDDIFEWQPEQLPHGFEIGKINGIESNVFVLRLEQNATIAIPLGAHGFHKLSKEIPSLWVTAPTRSNDSFGFAVSAAFHIDAGRGQLAGNNNEIAKIIGKSLGKKLSVLCQDCEQDWLSWRKKLRLSEDVALGQFLASLWETLTDGWLNHKSEVGYGLGATIAKTALDILLEKTQKIPTGLNLPFADYVEFSSIRFEANDDWNKKEILTPLKSWSIFSEKEKEKDKSILSSKIANVLREIRSDIRLIKLNTDALINLLNDKHCSSSEANVLEKILSQLPEEKENHLAELKFKSQIGHWTESRYLLQENSDDKEEAMRAAFAPEKYLLSQDYSGIRQVSKSAKESYRKLVSELHPDREFDKTEKERKTELMQRVNAANVENDLSKLLRLEQEVFRYEPTPTAQLFFNRCRLRFEANTERLLEWILIANDTNTHQAVLRYLLNGELGYKLAEALRDKSTGTWLANFSPNHPALYGWNEKDKNEICRLLTVQIYFTQPRAETAEENEPIKPTYSEDALESIYRWWVEEGGREKYLESYIKELYPWGKEPDLKLDRYGKINRAGWMTLLSIGMFQRLGRVQDYQTRGFIENMDNNGWWQIFCDVNPIEDEKSGLAWLQVLHAFYKNQAEIRDEEYSYWLDSFPRLFKISAWLEDYATSLIKRGNYKRDVPPLNKTLKKGYPLVVRELLRLGAITDRNEIDEKTKFAYTPSPKLLGLFEALGHNLNASELGEYNISEIIYKILCKSLGEEQAIFGGDYDIPLQILAHKSNQGELFRICGLEISSFEEEDYQLI